jgi:ferric-dicitrate binding protein FerR (iron transport regulator)
MFSSTDSPGNRHLHAVVQNEAARREVAIPAHLEEAALRATTLPTRARLSALASQLALLEAGGTFTWDEVVIQVWSADYDARDLMPSGVLLRSERFDIASP